MKTCSHNGCSNPVFSKGLCQNHWRPVYGKPIRQKVAPEPRFKLTQTEDGRPAKPFKVYATKAIKKISTRQQKLNAAYKVLRDQFMKAHPTCQAKLEGCTLIATDLHHSKGHGEFFLDATTFISLCRHCHQFIETHPEWAREKGFTQSRLSTTI